MRVIVPYELYSGNAVAAVSKWLDGLDGLTKKH